MFLVKTYLAKSEIHGMGVYAAEDIKKDSIIWKYIKNVSTIEFKEEDLESLLEVPKEFILSHAYLKDGIYYLAVDSSAYVNHSYNANCLEINEFCIVAGKDIKAGEELTEDYKKYDNYLRLLNIDESQVA